MCTVHIERHEAAWLKRIQLILLTLLILFVPFQINIQSIACASIQPITIVTTCPENATVYFFDVGQGDSILLCTPNRNVLIDGGPTAAGSTLLAYLNTYHISKIDLLFATHPHEDHLGGLVPVMQSTIPIQDIVYNGYNHTTQIFNTWILKNSVISAIREIIYIYIPHGISGIHPRDPPI